MSEPLLRSIETQDVYELVAYCRRLEAHQVALGIPPANPLIRFNIGQYQLAGAIAWLRAPACEYESYASAMIHFIVCMESLDMHVENYVTRDLLEPMRIMPKWDQVVLSTSRAVQHLLYCQQAGKTNRSKRFDRGQLSLDLGYLSLVCLRAIPTQCRVRAIHDATEILAKKI